MEKEQSENPRIQCELSNWKSLCYPVGESGDRSVRDEKEVQQAEKNEGFGHTEVPGIEKKEVDRSPDYDDEVISGTQKSTEDSV